MTRTAKEEAEEDALERHIAEVVRNAPPLSAKQAARLVVLLTRGNDGGAPGRAPRPTIAPSAAKSSGGRCGPA